MLGSVYFSRDRKRKETQSCGTFTARWTMPCVGIVKKMQIRRRCFFPAELKLSALTNSLLKSFYKSGLTRFPYPFATRAAYHLPSRHPPEPLLQCAGRQGLLCLQKSGGQGHGTHPDQLHSKLSELWGRAEVGDRPTVAKYYRTYQCSSSIRHPLIFFLYI